MRFIIKSIKQFIKNEPPRILGRWNIDYCNKKMNKKIDLSNEDHCGPCGEYILTKRPNPQVNIVNTTTTTTKKE
jgi:hypothetical protein